jgi:integrase/recombinase XerD
MFDQLYMSSVALARHRSGPLLKERLAFLAHLRDQGYIPNGLREKAQDLLAISLMLGLASRPRKSLTINEVERKTANRRCLFPLAVRWLRFMGRLQQRPDLLSPCEKKIKAFADYMKREELSLVTIYQRCWWTRRFFKSLRISGSSLNEVTPHRIDVAFQNSLEAGTYSRMSIRVCANALRTFFRFAEAQGWCRKGLAASIQAPRVYSQVSLPQGPSWEDVQRLLVTTEGDQRHNIRARPMLMLLAIYGLRAGEVNRLRLDDFDWEHEIFRVVSSKTGRVRTYPLTPSVGDAILRYLKEVRPKSPHRELFLSWNPPFRPVHMSLNTMVRRRLRSLDVSLSHFGPHVLRHACATRLLAAGLSLKEIGDQLGHQNPESTRIYAKVDLAGLREVADFDLGGVL